MSKKSTLKAGKLAVKILAKEQENISKAIEIIKSFDDYENEKAISSTLEKLEKLGCSEDFIECGNFLDELDDLLVDIEMKDKE